MLSRLLLVSAALVLGGCVHVDIGGSSDRFKEDFHHVFPLGAAARISVESHNGSVEIIGWDRTDAEVSGTKSASSESLLDSLKIDIQKSATSLQIRAVKPSVQMGGTGVRFMLRVPKSALVDRAETSNASVHVRDVAAATHLRSSNGSVKVENVSSDVDARTSNSSIDVDGISGEVQLKTSNGRISIERVTKRVDAETSNSSIKASLDGSSSVRLNTSNGSIDVGFAAQPKADVRAETKNSSITVHLPQGSGARVTADTSNSRVSSDFDVAGSPRGDEERQRNHLAGVIGGGGPMLDLATSNGSIRIVKGSGQD